MTSYHFLMDLAIILLSTKLMGLLTQRFHLPQVVGALAAGCCWVRPAWVFFRRRTSLRVRQRSVSLF